MCKFKKNFWPFKNWNIIGLSVLKLFPSIHHLQISHAIKLVAHSYGVLRALLCIVRTIEL